MPVLGTIWPKGISVRVLGSRKIYNFTSFDTNREWLDSCWGYQFGDFPGLQPFGVCGLGGEFVEKATDPPAQWRHLLMLRMTVAGAGSPVLSGGVYYRYGGGVVPGKCGHGHAHDRGSLGIRMSFLGTADQPKL